MYEIYCKLRDSKGIKDSDVVKATGITKSTFSDWKNGRSKPKNDKLQKIADYFGVSISYLTGESKTSLVFCNECGLPYDSSYPDDVKQHEKRHLAWEKATEKFGTIYADYAVREEIKAKNRNIRDDVSRPIDERLNAELQVLRCLFSRSIVGSGFDINHVTFEHYIAMMNKNPTYNIPKDIHELLVQKYGTEDGIDSGTYYHIPQKRIQTIAAHLDTSGLTEKELEDVKDYIEFIRNKRKK